MSKKRNNYKLLPPQDTGNSKNQNIQPSVRPKGQGFYPKDIKPIHVITASTDKVSYVNLILVSLAFIFIHIILVFVTNQKSPTEYNFLSRVWGFDNISFYPSTIIFIFYAIALLSCVPYINNKITSLFSISFINNQLLTLGKYKYLLFVLLSVLSFFLFRLFPIKYNFLGDRDILANQTVNGSFVGAERGTMWLLNYLYHFLNFQFNYTGIQTFVLQSFIAGSFFVFFH